MYIDKMIEFLKNKELELSQQDPPVALHPVEQMLLSLAKHGEALEKRIKGIETELTADAQAQLEELIP